MSRRSLLLVALAAVTLAGGGVAAGTASAGPVVVVADGDGEELLVVPVEEGTELTVEYTHSVEKTPVSDVYVVDGDELVMDRMLFSSFGAGLPSEARVSREGDRYVYRPGERRYDTLMVSTGPVAGHELVVPGQRYDLLALAEGGTVQVSIERRFRHTL